MKDRQQTHRPPIQKPPPRLWQVKVGSTIDGTEPRRKRNPKTGDIKEIYNANEPVFLRLTARHPGYELCDSLGRHIQGDFVRFDPAYNELEARLVKVETLQNASRH